MTITYRGIVAEKIADLPSALHVYSNDVGVDRGKVAPWPVEFVDDGPHALVGRGASTRSGGTGNQRLMRNVDVEWRFSQLDPASAERLIDQIEEEIIEAFSSDLTLGGRVIECVYAGSDAPFDFDDNPNPVVVGHVWVVWRTHFTVRERRSYEMTP